jgi:peptide/nickel transport system ATP-binding protein
MTEQLLKIENVYKYFPIKGTFFKKITAVDNVSLSINEGETLGIVGETGCGKTTLGKLMVKLLDPDKGNIFFKGKNVKKLKGRDLKWFRRNVQMVFQDPHSSLNPKMTIAEILQEPLREHKIDVGNIEEFLIKRLEEVGMEKGLLYRYPHELSGGQKQRVAILRASIINPSFIVFDEPTSSLDVSVQAQTLNLIKEMKRKYNLTYTFISHDLAVVRYMSEKIAVMYLGKIVEIGKSDEIFENPLHPYTKVLISAIPVPDYNLARTREKVRIVGEPPSLINPPRGCRFHTRCPFAMDICKEKEPQLIEIEKDHYVACWLYEKR